MNRLEALLDASYGQAARDKADATLLLRACRQYFAKVKGYQAEFRIEPGMLEPPFDNVEQLFRLSTDDSAGNSTELDWSTGSDYLLVNDPLTIVVCRYLLGTGEADDE